VEKRVNEGKAMALNDAMPVLRGKIVVVVDADIRPSRGALRHLVPHFASGHVAAVAGTPQVDNTRTLLAKVQVTEFASIVSVLRRAQPTWGRIPTVSGAICAFRRSAMVDVGLFDPDMATEDIALTWKLQRGFYDVRYEPRAVAAMQVPEDLPGPLAAADPLGRRADAGAAPARRPRPPASRPGGTAGERPRRPCPVAAPPRPRSARRAHGPPLKIMRCGSGPPRAGRTAPSVSRLSRACSLAAAPPTRDAGRGAGTRATCRR
jgi:cellulose synthase/poly-beta-1,6-N-acetylglucosamine synthase-like glycosyltransferase